MRFFGGLKGFFSLVCVLLCCVVSDVLAQVGQSCGVATDYDIIIMLDKTSSVSSADMTAQKNAAKDLLDLLKTFQNPPPVAFGKFHCPNDVNEGGDCTTLDGATILADFTSDYGKKNPATGLYKEINNVTTNTSGWTGYNWPITRAKKYIESSSTKSRHALFLIGDAMANRPRKDNDSDYSCPTNYAMGKANSAAEAAEALNIDIFTIYFNSSPQSGCPGYPQEGKDFFKFELATSKNHFFNGNSDLSGVLQIIAKNASCDDGNKCTFNSCNFDTNMCESTPTTEGDADNDGVDDCNDACPGLDDALLGQPCVEGKGACMASGVFVCGGAKLACDAEPGEPSTEVCNLIDDDCDGKVDEKLDDLGNCSAGVGSCMNSGVIACIDGAEVCQAEAGSGSSEVCNGIDDDCDGLVDEDLGNLGSCQSSGTGACVTDGTLVCIEGNIQCDAQPAQPNMEVCDGIDNDCDSQVDEGLSDLGSCSVGSGLCTNNDAVLSCVAGQVQCLGNPLAGSEEVCNGLDDDCDGQIDEDINPSGECFSGQGACLAQGAFVCAGGMLVCDANSGVASGEICNGIDDDCDGQIDEGLDNLGSCFAGEGSCQSEGVMVCVDGAPLCSASAIEPVDEVCDGFDNNCNGVIDEGNVCGCAATSLSGFSLEFDGNALGMFKYSKKMTKIAAKESGSGNIKISAAKLKKLSSKFLKIASELYMDIWHSAYLSIPQENIGCVSEVNCVSVSVASPLSHISGQSAKLVKEAKKYFKKSGLAKAGKGKSLIKKIQNLDAETGIAIEQFPKDVNQCPL